MRLQLCLFILCNAFVVGLNHITALGLNVLVVLQTCLYLTRLFDTLLPCSSLFWCLTTAWLLHSTLVCVPGSIAAGAVAAFLVVRHDVKLQ